MVPVILTVGVRKFSSSECSDPMYIVGLFGMLTSFAFGAIASLH